MFDTQSPATKVSCCLAAIGSSMELKVSTLKGSCVLAVDMDKTKTVGELKALLLQQHRGDRLDVPQPEQQRLVRVAFQPCWVLQAICCHVCDTFHGQ